MPDIALFTVGDLRNWLLHNHEETRLSEKILSPTRAWAIIHNPYVKDEDSVVAVLYVNGEVAAYTTAFPEMIDGERQWWFSSLWCAPEYRGQGYGLIVIGCLAETYGIEHCLDRWGASDTVGIFTYLGHKTVYTPRYILGAKINRNTSKGKVVYLLRAVQKCLRRLVKGKAKKEDYIIRYLPCIDNDTYAFLQAHRGTDYFLHSQEFLNWELQYSFTISAPLAERSTGSSFFQSEITDTQMYAVQVRDNDGIVGFYMMKRNGDCLHLLYLYYTEIARDRVFASIGDHIKRMRIAQFDSDDSELASYIRHNLYFSKYKIAEISFSYPESFLPPTDKTMQFGDGDNFAIVT